LASCGASSSSESGHARSRFDIRLANGAARNPDEETRKELAHALRPFLLRRTKEQVLRDLPPKVEQTLYCELEGKQRKLYEELRDHYRRLLLARIERDGIARSKIRSSEALLRLRQAALHPGLLDERRVRGALGQTRRAAAAPAGGAR